MPWLRTEQAELGGFKAYGRMHPSVLIGILEINTGFDVEMTYLKYHGPTGGISVVMMNGLKMSALALLYFLMSETKRRTLVVK